MDKRITQIVSPLPHARMRPDAAALAAARRAASVRTQTAQLQISQSLMPAAVLINALAGVLLASEFWTSLPHGRLLAWLAALALLTVSIAAFRWKYRRDEAPEERIEAWKRVAWLLALLDGLLWAAAAWLFLDASNAELVLPASAVALALGAAWPAFSSSWKSLLCFSLPGVAALAVRLTLLTGASPALGAATAVLGLAAILFAGRQLHSVFRRSIEADAEKERLVEQLRAEKRLSERALKATRDAVEDRARFFAGANHDLRQPMQAMGIFIQLLKKKASPQTTPLVAQIDSAAHSMASLVEEILEISRIDSGTLKPTITVVPLAPLFGQLAIEFTPMAAQKGLAFSAECSDEAVSTDELLLSRVLRNLCGNAIAHTDKAGGKVTLSARRTSAKALEITVRDSGEGIAPGEQEHIFDAFYRGKSARKRGGYGLGLSIVRAICRMLEIPLALDSRLGEGTTFILEFAAADPARAQSRPGQAEEPAAPLSDLNARVLLVDDDAMIRGSLARLFEQWGCTVAQADGFDADLKASLLAEPVDLIVTDHNLGDGVPTGLEGLFEVSSILPAVPAVILTAIPSDEIRRQYAAVSAARRREGLPASLAAMPSVLQKPTDSYALNRAAARQLAYARSAARPLP